MSSIIYTIVPVVLPVYTSQYRNSPCIKLKIQQSYLNIDNAQLKEGYALNGIVVEMILDMSRISLFDSSRSTCM